MSAPLTKVDSAIAGLSLEEKAPDTTEKEVKRTHRRASSQSDNVWNIKDLEEKKIEITLPIETQKTGWYVLYDGLTFITPVMLTPQGNSTRPPKPSRIKISSNCNSSIPPSRRLTCTSPLGLEVTARNLKGVTIKDALDAIYKQFKKKASSCPADDELEKPYLAGFEWDKDECWTRLIVHQTKEKTGQQQPSSKKSKKKNKDEAA
ncbi:hypothetical protein N7492_010122 [Penicillium capsulatum]|uniref:Uncharacterized protein n=1 Tax=Penicillium capsulatum TaxID=69766 RepID=A0A9W9HNU0_9EURO|nr:hypothetical protein N7492_010122 [Penicillium capsulatum]